MKHILPTKPKDAVSMLLEALPKRTKSILAQRFGLAKGASRTTLDAIGKKYAITRERVRQIEADGFTRIKKSSVFGELAGLFDSISSYFNGEGGVIREDKILEDLSGETKEANSVYFLLKLHEPVERIMENDDFHTRWVGDAKADTAMKSAVAASVAELRTHAKPVSKEKLLDILGEASVGAGAGILENWIAVSKLIDKNHFSEWGLTEFPEIKPRGVRDLSHMVLSKLGNPMHFSEVAGSIGKLIGKGVHVQTVHNELIKDDRFVLVGRGLYALKHWGYDAGTVRDVILKIFKNNGPLEKEKIVELVSKQRLVRPNTILINLENKKFFKKLQDGRYALR